MRLTLRTLLAYLDNILEPAKTQAMAQKIEESTAAAELVHRIRDVTKKVRLAAPSVEGKGLGLDANTVAEYLDNTLPGERTPDFEMVCLESDVHLAEVAACHEILSLVLVKPAEIDPATRQKMYEVINHQAPATKTPVPVEALAPTAVPVAAAVATPVPDDPRRKREVPEYLRQPEAAAVKARRGWQAALVAALILLLVVGAAVMALLPVDRFPGFMQPLARLFHPRPQLAINETIESGKPPTVVIIEPTPLPSGTKDAAVPAGPSNDLRQPESVTSPSADTATPAPPTPLPGTSTGAMTATTTAPVDPSTDLRQPASAVTTSADTPPLPSPTSPVPPTPSDVATPPAPAMSIATGPPTPVPPTTVPTGGTLPTTIPPPPTPAPPPAVAKVEPVGRVSSAVSQVVLRYSAEANAWVRLPAREQLMVGDRLLTLPDYRSQLALANGLTIDMFGGTLVELTPIDAAGTPGLLLLRGRLLMFTVGGAKASLRFDNSRTPTTFTLSTAELGMEFVPQRMPGADPTEPNPWIVRIYANNGQTAWSSGGGPETPMTAPGTWILGETTAPLAAPQEKVPTWLVNDERDLLQKQAADAVEARLRGDKAVSVALREILSDHPPRMENVQLALRSLAQIGEFADFMPLLRDSTQRYSSWDRYVDMLVEALDFGPAYADQIRTVFVTQHGALGESEYRMLWGYTDEQLQAGAAQFLVESLNNPELDVRIISYWTLCDVTGLSLSYLPQDPDLKRKPNIQKWQAKLEAGQIVRKQAP